MESPRWASVRISEALEMVREVPPPPVAVSSCGIREETAVEISFVAGWGGAGGWGVVTCFRWFLLFR